MLVTANIFQPLIDVFQSVLLVLPQQRRSLVGLVDRPADDLRADGAGAADDQAVPLDAQDAAAQPADEGDPGEVQGGQAAPAGRDDEVLPGGRHQPVRLLPAAGRCSCRSSSRCSTCCARTCATTSARTIQTAVPDDIRARAQHQSGRCAAARRTTPCGPVPRGRLPLHPRHHRPGARRHADRAAGPLRRHAAVVDDADVGSRRWTRRSGG